MRFTVALSLLFCGAVLVADTEPPAARAVDLQRSNALVRIQTLVTEGRTMSPIQAQRAESVLSEMPEELDIRYRLLGYYAGKMNQNIFDARKPHILWFVEHRPEDAVFSTTFVQVDQRFEQDTYEQAMRAWSQQIAAQPKNTTILGHAARFALRNDREAAMRLLTSAKQIEPTNPEWPRKLAGLHSLHAFFNPGTISIALAKQINAEWNDVYRLLVDEDEKLRLLPQLAVAAIDAGDSEAASVWAGKALESVDALKKRNRHGDAVHGAHSVLGRLALSEGRIEAAKEHLIASGKTPGSLRMNSFGPNMRLAHELSLGGQRETVVEYLDSCRAFWANGGARLDEWIEILEDGDNPDFGNNLKL